MRSIFVLALIVVGFYARAEIGDAKLSLLEVRCDQPGNKEKANLGLTATNILINDRFRVTGYPVTFEIKPSDSDSEFDQLQLYKYSVAAKPVSIDCAQQDLHFRVLGLDDPLSLDQLMTRLPFQSRCDDSHRRYKNCEDASVVIEEAIQSAASAGQLVLINYGYDGCAWCDSMANILHDAKVGAPVRERFKILDMSISYATNRTTRIFLKNLAREKGVQRSSGIPELFLLNPTNGNMLIVDPKDLEDNDKDKGKYDYHREELIQKIMETAGQL